MRATLNIYTGPCDIHGEQAKYTFDNEMIPFKRDVLTVKQACEIFKPDFRKEYTTLEMAPQTELIVSTNKLNGNH